MPYTGLFRCLLTSIFVSIALIAPSLPIAAQDVPAHAPSALPGPAISGIVHSERGPLAGVTVVIRGPVTLSFTTKAGGVFQFTGIPAGTYRLSATAPGYLPLSNSLVTTTAESPQTLTVLLDTASLTTLRTITSTSTTGRGSVSINTSGAAESTITSQDYIDRGDAQVQNELEELPGVELERFSSGGAPGANTDIAVRGAAPYETQTLIDGHPILSGDDGDYLIQFVNPLALSDIEIDKGPGVFGNTIQNAVGGTVNFRTPGITSDLEGRLTTGYDSYNGSTYSARISDTIGKVGFLAAYGFDGTPGYFTGDILSVDSNPPGAQKGVVPLGTINEAVPASEAYQNRSQVFKLAYNFSPTTSLTLGSIGEQTYVDYTATLDTVEPVTIEEECVSCAPNGANTFNNPIYNGLIGKTVLASTSEDDLFLGNFELDNEPIFTADLRTTFGPGNFLGRYYTGAINRQIDDPEEANQVIACTTPSCSSPTLDTPFYESEIDVLHGADFEYSAPWGRSGQDVATVSYDQHSDLSRFCDGGSTLFTASDCSVNNLLLLSRTFSVRAFANVAPKLRVGFANYFSDTTFVGKRYDPRATIVWTPQRSTAVRFAVGTAYVAPPTSFVAPVAGENKAVVNGTLDVADDLKPETSAGVDLGADLGIHGDSKFTLDLYETALTNRFSTITILPGAGFGVGSTFGTFDGTPFSKIKEVYNASDANEEGIEFGYVRAPRVGLGADVDMDLLRAYNYNTVIPSVPGVSVSGAQPVTVGGDALETPGFQIPGYPYWHGRLEVSYTLPSTAKFAFGQTIYGANNSFGEPGFSLFDFDTNLPINYGVRVVASVTNIFNHDDYRTLGEYAYGYTPPGETTPVSLFFAPPRRINLQLDFPFGGS